MRKVCLVLLVLALVSIIAAPAVAADDTFSLFNSASTSGIAAMDAGPSRTPIVPEPGTMLASLALLSPGGIAMFWRMRRSKG